MCVCVCVCVGFYPLPTLTLFSSTWFSVTYPVFLYIKYFPINCSYWRLTQYNAFTEGKRRDTVNSWGFPQASTYICANESMRYVNIFFFVPIFCLHHYFLVTRVHSTIAPHVVIFNTSEECTLRNKANLFLFLLYIKPFIAILGQMIKSAHPFWIYPLFPSILQNCLNY